MALNDAVATLVMGEIDDLTKKIDRQISQVDASVQALNDLDQKLIQSQENLVSATSDAQRLHLARLADSMSSVKTEIEARTQDQIDRIKAEVVAITDDEVRVMRESGDNIRSESTAKTLTAIEAGVSQRISAGMQGVEKASDEFRHSSKVFSDSLTNLQGHAREAVKNYGEALQEAVEKHRPLGWFGTWCAGVAGGAVGFMLVAFLANHGFMPFSLQAKEMTVAEKVIFEDGKAIEKAWPKLTKKEKDRLQAEWQ